MQTLQEDTFIYFAYGSNLLTERLQARCPSATFIGNAKALGYKLVFNKMSSVDQSAKANIFHTRLDTDIVEGVLFVINKNEEHQLDTFEGYNKDKYKKGDYSKETIPIYHDSKKIPAATYFAHIDTEKIEYSVYDWYFALIIAGAVQHKLPDAYIKDLISRTKPIADPDTKRPRRLEALSIIEKAGYLSIYQELSK